MRYFYFFFVLFLLACKVPDKASSETDVVLKKDAEITEDEEETRQLVTYPVVKKAFVNKAGKVLDFEEYYLQQSVQDYFIKFCESDITVEELEEALENSDEMIKTLTLEVTYREGEWDICDKDEIQAQSRIGRYVIIHKIIQKI